MRLQHRVVVASIIGTVVLCAGALAGVALGGSPPPKKDDGHGVVRDASPNGHAQESAPEPAEASGQAQGAAEKAPKPKPAPSKGDAHGAATAGKAPKHATSPRSACAGSPAFSQFGDHRSYSLLANGTLETGRPARRAGKPAIVQGNESFYLHDSGDRRSLRLRPGQSVAFHATCLPRLNPLFRFVARADDGAGTLDLYVQYGAAKRRHAAELGALASGDYAAWTATPVLPFLNGARRLLDQVKGNVWLVLTASGSATWRVDDLYIDPYVNR